MSDICFNYTFPVFYTLALKEKTRFSQVDLLSHLLMIQKQDNIVKIDDSTCSNYARGKTKISSSYRTEFYLNNIERIKSVIDYLDIKEIKESIFCIQTLLLNGKLQLHDVSKRDNLLACLSGHESPEYKITYALIVSINNNEQLELLDYTKQKALLNYREKAIKGYGVSSTNNEHSAIIQEQEYLFDQEDTAYQQYEIILFLLSKQGIVGFYDQVHAFAVENNIHPLCDYSEDKFTTDLVCHVRFPDHLEIRLSEGDPYREIQDISSNDLLDYLHNLS